MPTITMRMRVWHAQCEYEKHGANIRVATSADFCLSSHGRQVKQCLRVCHHVIHTPVRLSCACFTGLQIRSPNLAEDTEMYLLRGTGHTGCVLVFLWARGTYGQVKLYLAAPRSHLLLPGICGKFKSCVQAKEHNAKVTLASVIRHGSSGFINGW